MTGELYFGGGAMVTGVSKEDREQRANAKDALILEILAKAEEKLHRQGQWLHEHQDDPRYGEFLLKYQALALYVGKVHRVSMQFLMPFKRAVITLPDGYTAGEAKITQFTLVPEKPGNGELLPGDARYLMMQVMELADGPPV